MNLTTMQIDNETLNYQYIIDLINETDCMYYYCLEDNCGYLYFYNNIQLSEVCEEVCQRLDILFMLEKCYNM